jgi:hypothetical protein
MPIMAYTMEELPTVGKLQYIYMITDISTTDTGGITVKRGGLNYKLSPSNFSVVVYKNRLRMFISAT